MPFQANASVLKTDAKSSTWGDPTALAERKPKFDASVIRRPRSRSRPRKVRRCRVERSLLRRNHGFAQGIVLDAVKLAAWFRNAAAPRCKPQSTRAR